MAVRKGFLLTVDAILASILFLAAIVLLFAGHAETSDTYYAQRLSEDVVASLNAITVAEYAQHYPDVLLVLNDTLLTEDDSLLYTMSMLWVLNDSRLDPLALSLEDHLPPDAWLQLSFHSGSDTTPIYVQTADVSDRVRTVSSQQVTGIDRGQPVAGSSSTAYLTRLRDKQTRSFAYFGGFVGQGNITVILELPEDASPARMSELVAELDTPQEFSVFMNGNACGTYIPTTAPEEPDTFNLSSCIPHVISEENLVRISFDNLTTGYIAGGFINAAYTTDTFTSNPDLTTMTYRFPEITGVVNLYDAFSVPAPIQDMEVYLHYTNPDPTTRAYLSIGELVVYESGATGTVSVTLTNQDLLDAGVDYLRLENTTVPIRFAAYNAVQENFTGGTADVVLVTDYSASMMKSITGWGQGNSANIGDCDGVFTQSDVRRTHLARCLDKDVVNALFNESGNRLWPVHYVDDVVYRYNNPDDPEALTGFFETFTGSFPQQGRGKTCISCALAEAHDIFSAQDPERPKFVILMSDGLPTHCSDAGCEGGLSSQYGSLVCEGLCDVQGQNCNAFANLCSDYSCGPAMDDATYAAQRLVDDYNVTIYTIGFGPMTSCPNAMEVMLDIATIGNGTYQHSSDAEELRLIYENITTEITTQLEQVSQTVIVPGAIAPSTLYGDSAITINHDLPIEDIRPNEIEITQQTPPFGSCNPTIALPQGVRFRSAQVLSYSGPHWTDLVAVNDVEVFNLSQFFVNYSRLGDPYIVGVQVNNFTSTTELFMRMGDTLDESFGCSPHNSLVYTVFVPSATARTTVLNRAEGCVWTIETEFDTQVVPIPSDYSGSNTCSYTSSSISYDNDDSMQVAVYQLLSSLDFDDSGTIFLNLEAEDLEIIVNRVASVPYLWGPIRFSVEARS